MTPERKRAMDPIEKIVADALDARGIAWKCDDNGTGLDVALDGVGVCIECKQFHTPRTNEQMARVENVIVIQGRAAAQMFAAMIADDRCPNTTDGKHRYASYSVGTDGRLLTHISWNASENMSAGFFCLHCYKPK